MNIFISWSGTRSKEIAKIIKKYLPSILPYVEPWMSEEDISAGARWSPAIAEQLEASNFGLICLTPENSKSLWVHFEAGAIAKSVQDGKVIPLLFDLENKDYEGPITQFQAKKLSREDFRTILESIQKSSKDNVLKEERLNLNFEMAWPKIEDEISKISMGKFPPKPSRSESAILEELVSAVRSMDSRLANVENFVSYDPTLHGFGKPGAFSSAFSSAYDSHIPESYNDELMRMLSEGFPLWYILDQLNPEDREELDRMIITAHTYLKDNDFKSFTEINTKILIKAREAIDKVTNRGLFRSLLVDNFGKRLKEFHKSKLFSLDDIVPGWEKKD